MAQAYDIVKDILQDNSKIFFNTESNLALLDMDRIYRLSLECLRDNPDNTILKTKFSAILKEKAIKDNISVRLTLDKCKKNNHFIKITDAELGKRARLNNHLIEMFNKDRVSYDIYKTFIVDYGYSVLTIDYNIDWLYKNGLIDELGKERLLDIIKENKNTDNDPFTLYINESKLHKKCDACNKELNIFNFGIGRKVCKTCQRLVDLRRVKGEEAAQDFLAKQEVLNSIEKFKDKSKVDDTEVNTVIHEDTYTKIYLDIISQLDTIKYMINDLKTINIKDVTQKEKEKICLNVLDLNKELIEMERLLYE